MIDEAEKDALLEPVERSERRLLRHGAMGRSTMVYEARARTPWLPRGFPCMFSGVCRGLLGVPMSKGLPGLWGRVPGLCGASAGCCATAPWAAPPWSTRHARVHPWLPRGFPCKFSGVCRGLLGVPMSKGPPRALGQGSRAVRSKRRLLRHGAMGRSTMVYEARARTPWLPRGCPCMFPGVSGACWSP